MPTATMVTVVPDTVQTAGVRELWTTLLPEFGTVAMKATGLIEKVPEGT